VPAHVPPARLRSLMRSRSPLGAIRVFPWRQPGAPQTAGADRQRRAVAGRVEARGSTAPEADKHLDREAPCASMTASAHPIGAAGYSRLASKNDARHAHNCAVLELLVYGNRSVAREQHLHVAGRKSASRSSLCLCSSNLRRETMPASQGLAAPQRAIAESW
jgi:hypothetical protein